MAVKRNKQAVPKPRLFTIREEDIRLRSYLIWEREGRPNGRDKIHWQMAIDELIAEHQLMAKPPAPRKPATRRASPRKAPPRGGNGTAVM